MKLFNEDNIEALKSLPDNSVDSVVTDPPYGLKFMGKKWDYDVPKKEFWEEVYRVLKPGGHVLSFGGTRTYHRMVVNMEDAGFEIRDQIMWIYSTGFPKSLNIGKQVDKIQGNEREVVGKSNSVSFKDELIREQGSFMGNIPGRERIDLELTKGSSPQEGWGTALKPAQEIIAVAQKPLENLEGTALNLIYIIKKELWKLYVKIVEQSSELNQVEQKEVLNIAQCLVENNTNIQESLQGLMDMLLLKLMVNLNLSTVMLWSNILVDLSNQMNTFTTEMKSNLIIDLRTLKLLEWENILENITQVKNNSINGLNANALTAVSLFNVFHLKLKDIQQLSVTENVIYKEDKKDCLSNAICLARKPISEKNITENVLKWGTGGINVDGCRIGSDSMSYVRNQKDKGVIGFGMDKYTSEVSDGRFPANILFDEDAAKVLDGQSGLSKSTTRTNFKKDNTPFWDKSDDKNTKSGGHNDSGGSSRFFYVAKVSSKERNLGLDGFEEKDKFENKSQMFQNCHTGTMRRDISPSKNNHPTVKPINLLTYLIRLITPQNGIVMDPFMGSGSTGIASRLQGFDFIGMELDSDYFKIAKKRIEKYEDYRDLIKNNN